MLFLKTTETCWNFNEILYLLQYLYTLLSIYRGKYVLLSIRLWQHSATMYIVEAKCLMSHQHPNGLSVECSRKRRAWQRWRTPHKRADSGDIEGRQKEKNRIRSIVRFELGSDKVVGCNRTARLTSETESDTRRDQKKTLVNKYIVDLNSEWLFNALHPISPHSVICFVFNCGSNRILSFL